MVDLEYTDAETLAIYVATIASSFLSLVGSGFILASFVRFDWLRSHQLIAYLSFCDFVLSGNYLLGATRYSTTYGGCPDAWCVVHAAVTQYFTVAALSWIACIAFNLYTVFRFGESYGEGHVRYHVFCWGGPAVLLLVAAGTGSLGDTGLWCWVAEDRAAVRLICYYVPLLTTLVVDTVAYARIRALVRSSALEARVNTRLRHYLLVFVVCNFFPAMNRLQSLLRPYRPWFVLNLLQAIFGPLQGAGNALVYGWTTRMKAAYSSLPSSGSGAGRVDSAGSVQGVALS